MYFIYIYIHTYIYIYIRRALTAAQARPFFLFSWWFACFTGTKVQILTQKAVRRALPAQGLIHYYIKHDTTLRQLVHFTGTKVKILTQKAVRRPLRAFKNNTTMRQPVHC